MTIDLNYRTKRFKNIFSNNKIKKLDLLAFSKIENKYFNRIKKTCVDFIIASFQSEIKFNKKEKDLNSKLNFIKKNLKNLYSMTPNGFIIPKSHSYKEYNKLMKLYYGLFKMFDLKNKIDSWQEPIGVCVKYYDGNKIENKKSGRIYHQTSNAHIESWAGYSNLGINTLLPIYGDIKKNYTEFFQPKKNFDDLAVNSVNKKNYKKIISQNYNKFPLNPKIKKYYKCGNLACWDNVVLHKTKIKNKNSLRIFIVNQFIPTLNNKELAYNKISLNRKNRLLKHKIISDKKSYLKFEKKNDYKFKSTLGGRRAAYDYKLIK